MRTWTRASHRWLGMVLLLPLTIACLTGLILNHTVDLDLSNRHVTNPLIQSRYGMTLDGRPTAYGLDGKAYAAQWNGQLFHRSTVMDAEQGLVGAVPLRDGTAVVTSYSVHYFGLDGELIETLGSVALPSSAPFFKAGRTQDLRLVLETGRGNFSSDANLLEFIESPGDEKIEWSTVIQATEADIATWKTAFSGDGIPLDRVILDLHSGRFFGAVGKWIYDLTVIGVLILSITGFILFLRGRRRSRSQ